MKKYFNLFDLSQKVDFKTEVLSGLTVALALVPEAVAFALIAGLSPLTGLYAAFMMGLVTSIFGGRPGMISGATGAIAVVIVVLAKSHGVEYVFATVVLAGIIQVTAGFLRLGKLIRLVPHPVIFGFVNGLAIIIFMSQLSQFKDVSGNWLTGSRSGASKAMGCASLKKAAAGCLMPLTRPCGTAMPLPNPVEPSRSRLKRLS